MSTSTISTVQPQYTNTASSLITNRALLNEKQNSLFNGSSTGGSGTGTLPSYLPVKTSPTLNNAGSNATITISGLNNIKSGIGTPSTSGGKRKSKRRKTKRRKIKRRKTKRRK
jgi:hypothetical protein